MGKDSQQDIRQRLIELDHARAWRTYAGGRRLNRMLGQTLDSHFPEEWIMSVVRARNAGREDVVEGYSFVKAASGEKLSLKEWIEAAPDICLGAKHVKKYGSTLGVLVKLIDADERLTIQVHPTREMARELFDSAFGKTESWYVLGGAQAGNAQPVIYLGFKEGITKEAWRDVFDRQDIPAMLDLMHCFPVHEGDMILIEGGVPHAIGAGCFLAEIQEPTDYTIRTEKVTPQGFPIADVMCHQGLGFEKMFDCFVYQGYSEQEAKKRWFIRSERTDEHSSQLIGAPKTDLFALRKITAKGDEAFACGCGEQFCGFYCLKGSGTFITEGGPVPYQAPAQFFLGAPQKGESPDIRIVCSEDSEILQFFGPEV